MRLRRLVNYPCLVADHVRALSPFLLFNAHQRRGTQATLESMEAGLLAENKSLQRRRPYGLSVLRAQPSTLHRKMWDDIQQRRSINWDWPPPHSSPHHPIEPWGKRIFVFNTDKAKELDGEAKNRTLLCISDHSTMPKVLLTKSDFEHLVAELPYVTAQLSMFTDRMNEEYPLDTRFEKKLFLYPRRASKFTVQDKPLNKTVYSRTCVPPPKERVKGLTNRDRTHIGAFLRSVSRAENSPRIITLGSELPRSENDK